MKSKKMSNAQRTYFHVAMGAILGLAILLFLKPVNGLEQTGVNVLAAFATIMYWWIAIGSTWPVLAGVPLLSLSGVMTYRVVVQSGLGNANLLFILITVFMNVALMKTGISERIVLWFITRNAVRNKPYTFLLFYMLGVYVLSLVMAGATVCVVLLGVVRGICDELGLTKEDKLSKTLYLLLNWIGLTGFIATPIGHSTTVTAITLIETFCGVTVSFGQWCLIGIPISILWFILIFLTVRFFFKIDMTKYQNYDVDAKRREYEAMPAMTTQQKVTIGIFLACVVCFFLPDLTKSFLPGFAAMVTKIGTGSIMIIGVSLLCIIHVNGRPILTWKEAITEADYAPVFMGITNYAIATAFGVAETGITAWVTYLVSPIASSLTSWVPFVLVISALGLFLTQIMSCGTIETILITTALPIAIGLGNINPIATAMIITYVSNMGLMTPPASGGAAVTLATGYLTPKDGVQLGWWCLPQGLLVSLIAYPLLASFWSAL